MFDLSAWTTMVIMYFIVSVVNNAALGFNISMPLHMIFRAVSVFFNNECCTSPIVLNIQNVTGFAHG